MKNLNKGFAFVPVLVIGALLIIGGAYFFLHTNERTNTSVSNVDGGFKQYKNDNYKFTINFPSNLPADFSSLKQAGGKLQFSGNYVLNLEAGENQQQVQDTTVLHIMVAEKGEVGGEPYYGMPITGDGAQPLEIAGTQGNLWTGSKAKYSDGTPADAVSVASGLHGNYVLVVTISPIHAQDEAQTIQLAKQIAATVQFSN